MGLILPAPLDLPVDERPNHAALTIAAGYAYVAGQGPMDGATTLAVGKVGEDLSTDMGVEAARLTALSMLALLKDQSAT